MERTHTVWSTHRHICCRLLLIELTLWLNVDPLCSGKELVVRQRAYVHWESHWGVLLSSPKFSALKMSTRSSSGARSIGVLPSYSDKGCTCTTPHTVQQLKELQRRNLQTSQHTIWAVPSNAKVLRWLSSWEVSVNTSSRRAPYTQC